MPAPRQLRAASLANTNTIMYDIELIPSVMPGAEPYHKYYLHIIDPIQSTKNTTILDHVTGEAWLSGNITDLSYSTLYMVYVESCLVWSYDRLISVDYFEPHSEDPVECVRSSSVSLSTGMYAIPQRKRQHNWQKSNKSKSRN